MRDQLVIHALSHRSCAAARGQTSGAGGKRDAFADPLDQPAWEGLAWIVPFLTAVTGGARPRPARPSRTPRPQPVRFYTRSPLRMR